jgi:hypothetical protein
MLLASILCCWRPYYAVGVHIVLLASILCCWRPDINYRTIGLWLSDCNYFLLSNYQNIEYRIGEFKKYRTIGYRNKASIYRISDSGKTIGCPPLPTFETFLGLTNPELTCNKYSIHVAAILLVPEYNRGIFYLYLFFFYVLYSTRLHLPPLSSTVSEDAGTVATSALAVRRSNHYARSHPV